MELSELSATEEEGAPRDRKNGGRSEEEGLENRLRRAKFSQRRARAHQQSL